MGKKKKDKEQATDMAGGGSHGGETHELAGLLQRLAAGFIDMVLSLLLLMLIMSLLAGGAVAAPEVVGRLIYTGVPIAYYWYFWTRREGQTPGKFALGIRVVKADGSPIKDVDAVIRVIGYQVSAAFLCLGFIWALFDRENQTWHDKLARTYVVRADNQRKTVETGA